MSLKTLVQRHLGFGMAGALGRIRFELRTLIRHRYACGHAGHLWNEPLVLNCGCGDEFKPGWVNIDLGSRKADLQLDLRRPLPFPKDSVAFIYSEHFLEHLEYPSEVTQFLSESFRVLKPGGRFRVGVPDAEWALLAYVTRDESFFELCRTVWGDPKYCDTRLHHINYLFRQDSEHKYAYDCEMLTKVLAQSGFTRIVRSDFDPALDSEARRLGTLYIDAFTPS